MEQLDSLFASFPQLETERFVLRETRPTDVEAILACYGDDEVMRYYDADTFTDIQQAARVVTTRRTRYQNKRGVRWTIATKDNDLANRDWAIGSIGFHAIVRHYFKVEVGYELSRAYWRQGVMTEVLTAVCQYAFNQLGFNRIEALVMPGNVASLQLLEKLGFQNEGLLREYGYWKGAFHDLYMLSLLNRDAISAKGDISKAL
ncbi:MAG: GNAT family protein [Chloroflexota bacterium]